MESLHSDIDARIAQLWVYPVKSCAGIDVSEAVLTETGLDLDRAWMVVDEHGEFVSQRDHPRMALIQPKLRHSDIMLRAPGMLALHLSVNEVEEPVRARVWDDVVQAYDMGNVAAQWFSDFLGAKLRLVRFDPEHRRLAEMKWTHGREVTTQFADGFPLLVTSEASHALLSEKLQAAGQGAVDARRMRSNIVLSGVQAHDEDRLASIVVDTPEGPVELKPCKPCARCQIPDVDPDTAQAGGAVNAALRGYRADARVGGALTFGMNAYVADGAERTLRVGQAVRGRLAFD